MSDEEVDKLMMERNYNDQELLLQAIQFIAKPSADALEEMVINSDSLPHLFRNAVSNLPLNGLGEFVTYGYEVIKPYIARELAERYRLSAAA